MKPMYSNAVDASNYSRNFSDRVFVKLFLSIRYPIVVHIIILKNKVIFKASELSAFAKCMQLRT